MIGLNLPRFTHVMGLMILLACMVAVSGCAEWAALRNSATAYGEQAADESLDLALNHMCQVSTVGAVKRRFKTVHEINAYNALCKDFLPLSAEE
jgi:hypothetical protein